MLVHPAPAALEQAPILAGGLHLAEMLRHLRARLEGAQVEAGEPGIGTEQLHVQGMVLAAFQDAVAVGVPAVLVAFRPRELDRFLHRGPVAPQPVAVAADLPVAVGLDHAAELPVRAGAEGGALRAERQAQAEPHAAVRALVVGEVEVAHRALQLRKQKRQRVGVVPDVGAGALAAALFRAQPLEAVERAVGEAQAGGRLQHRQVGRGRLQGRGRQGGAVQRLLEAQRLAMQAVPVLQGVAGAGGGVLEQRGVVVLPGRRRGRRLALRAGPPVLGEVGEAPGDDEAHAALRARRQVEAGAQGAGVAALETDSARCGFAVRIAALRHRAGRGELAPVHLQAVEPGAAEPALLCPHLRAGGGGIGSHAQVAAGRVILPHPGAAQREGRRPARAAGGTIESVAAGTQRRRVGQRHGHGVAHRRAVGVAHPDLEERRGNAGVAVVEGNERVERGHRHGAGKCPAGKLQVRERKLAAERHRLHVRRTRHAAALRAEAESFGGAFHQLAGMLGGQVAVEDTRVEQAPVTFRFYGEVAVAVDAALVGAVEDLPVDQPAAAGQADAAAADAAERKRDLPQAVAGVDAAW